MNDRPEHMTQPSLVRRLLLVSLAGFAFVLAAVAVPIATAALTPAQAQVSAEFQSALDSYGAWVRHPRWGDVWVPDDVGPGWRPYTNGRWIYTDEWGWYWVPDEDEEDWGWVTYHYGRWAHDRRLGWFWIPGEEWGPAWVDWRRGDDYVGWAPLPPDEVIYEYDDDPIYWVFLRLRYLLEPRPHRHFLPQSRSRTILRNTVVINRTVAVEHRRNGRSRIAVNAGVSPAIVAAARRSPVPAFSVSPQVLSGTRNVAGAVAVRPQDLRRPRPGQRNRALAPRIQRTNVTVRPATTIAKPRPLGKNERGRLGTHPPRAARDAIVAPPPAAPQPRTAPTPAPSRTAPASSPAPRVVAPPPVRQDRPAAPPSPQVTPQRSVAPPPQVKPQPSVAPPPSQAKPPPRHRTIPPSRAKPQEPAPPKASPPQIRRERPSAPRLTPSPAVRSAPRPPAVQQPPRPAAPNMVRPAAPPPQVRKPPPPPAQVQRPAPAQVHRPPPVQKPPPPQAQKPPPKKPGDKDDKDKKK